MIAVLKKNYYLLLFLVLSGFVLVYFLRFISNPIYDIHGFRQAQTAIPVQYMTDWKSFINYETPVMGPPWSIPMEFPLFQGIVKVFHDVTRLSVDISGRVVSIVFFLGIFFALYGILRELNFSKTTFWVCALLLVTSPSYIFWSRTFMIESTAVFFGLMYVLFALRLAKGRRNLGLNFVLCLSCGALVALTKITTFFPMSIAAFFLTMKDCKWLIEIHRIRVNKVAIALATIVALALGLFWTKHADSLKNLNYIAGGYIDSSSLHWWNFGSLEQRFSSHVWNRVYKNTVLIIVEPIALLIFIAFVSYKVRKLTAIYFVVAFLSAYLMFLNLHYVHEYYPYANGILLITAVGIALSEYLSWRPIYKQLLVSLIIVGNLTVFFRFYYPVTLNQNQRIFAIGDYLKKNTPQDSVLLLNGFAWSSELPYETQRRSLMVFELPRTNTVQRYKASIQKMKADNIFVSAYVTCGKTPFQELDNYISEFYDLRNANHSSIDGCDIFLLRKI